MDFDDKVLQKVYKAEQNLVLDDIWNGDRQGVGDALKRLKEKGFIKKEGVDLVDYEGDGTEYTVRRRYASVITDAGRRHLYQQGLIID